MSFIVFKTNYFIWIQFFFRFFQAFTTFNTAKISFIACVENSYCCIVQLLHSPFPLISPVSRSYCHTNVGIFIARQCKTFIVLLNRLSRSIQIDVDCRCTCSWFCYTLYNDCCFNVPGTICGRMERRPRRNGVLCPGRTKICSTTWRRDRYNHLWKCCVTFIRHA